MTIEFELDGRLPCAGFASPGKHSVELTPSVAADQHEIQANHKLDISRNRVQGGDKSRVDDARLDSPMNADEVNMLGLHGEVKKESEAEATMSNREILQVRADGGLACDVAQPDSRKIIISNLRDSRNEDGHGLCEEDEQMDESVQAKAGKGRSRILQEAVSQGVRQAQLLYQQQQSQQQQVPVVRWERFLPQRQLRVLLVEDDDSTRHVVSALLRNCSYEVTFAANGLLAWELLLDQTNRIDLILTEVVMPCLSGIGLLSRIMGHEAFKHIPVIMMSSHDSMGIVFKCLSKGAVDFLVKPVRKNELKNLWQHVWRRCHSSSGSGSGSSSGSQTQKVASPKVAAGCNNFGSNDESDNTSSGLNAVGGSDNGSGTQSSWTKKAVEVESSQHQTNQNLMNPIAGSTECPTKQPEGQQEGSVKGFALKPPKENCFDAITGQDSEIASLQLAATESACFHKDTGTLKSACVVLENLPVTSKGDGGLMENTANGSLQEGSIKAIDLIGAITGKAKSSEEEEQGESQDRDELLENHASNSPFSKNKTVSDFNSPPLLELTLKRPSQFAEDVRERNGGHVLRHSCSSAFSRYNTSGNHVPSPSGTLPSIGNCNAAGYGGHAAVLRSNVGSSNPSSVSYLPQLERAASSTCGADAKTPPAIMSNLSSVNSKQDCFMSPFPPGKDGFEGGPLKDGPMPLHRVSGTGVPMPIPLPRGILYDSLPSGYGPVRHPMFYVGHANAPPWGSQVPAVVERGEDDDCCGSHKQSPAHRPHQQMSHNSKTHHHPHHRKHHRHHHVQHHYHHHHRQLLPQQGPQAPQLEDQTVTNVGGDAPICGSSNMINCLEGNAGQSGSTNGYASNGNGNGSLNGSATGSNNGSNNGQSAGALTAGGNGDAAPQLGNSGAGTGNANNGALSSLDQNRFARREAALTKFRQKRKERCFEKKVRYQSRKRLAEQRPRVRGQFVRQSVYESTAGEPG